MKNFTSRICFRKPTQINFLKVIAVLFAILFFKNVAQAQPPDFCAVSIKLLLNLNGGAANTADGCVVLYKNNFSAGIGNEDSQKFTNLDENLAINRNGVLLSMEGRPPFTAHDTLPLKIWQYRQNSYFLTFACTNFSPTLEAVVKDNYLQQEFPLGLSGSCIMPFVLNPNDSASYSPDRFCIVFRPAGTTLACNFLEMKAAVKDNDVQLDWTTCSQTNVVRYEVERATNGYEFAKLATVAAAYSSTSKAYSWLDANTNSGDNYYRIKAIEKSGQTKYSAVVKVNTGKSYTGINIYPNPVKGSVIGVQMMNMQQGKFAVRIFNNEGKQVYGGTLTNTGKSTSQLLQLNKHFAKGIYSLQLSNESLQIIRPLLFD